jgi:hypothetical protein
MANSAAANFTWDDDKPTSPKSSSAFTWESDKTAPQVPPEPKAPPAQSTWEKIKTGAVDLAKGAGEGALQTGLTLSPLINKIPYIGETLAPSAGIRGAEELATPANTTQKVGKIGEQVAEFAIPTGVAAKEAQAAGKLIPFLGRTATGLVGGLTGSQLGKYGGRMIGGETGGEIGEIAGGLAGGLAGTGVFGESARKIGNPRDIPEIGKYLPDLLKSRPKIVSPAPFELTPEPAMRETAVQLPLQMPSVAPEGRPPSPMKVLQQQIEGQGGWKPLEPNVPLREQPNFPGPPNWRHPRLLQTPEWEPGRMQAPENLPKIVTEEPARQAGAPPLKANVPLREQLIPKTGEPAMPSEQARLEQAYPDKAIRQMVHSNGEKMVGAVGDDKDLMKEVHDLTNPDVRQALINAGEDMGQRSIGNRKAMGESQMTRQEAFDRLLAKGFSPRQIVDLAKQPMEHLTAR